MSVSGRSTCRKSESVKGLESPFSHIIVQSLLWEDAFFLVHPYPACCLFGFSPDRKLDGLYSCRRYGARYRNRLKATFCIPLVNIVLKQNCVCNKEKKIEVS
jgi:hypothetical protein